MRMPKLRRRITIASLLSTQILSFGFLVLLVVLPNEALIPFSQNRRTLHQQQQQHHHMALQQSARGQDHEQQVRLPKLIVFDLDGCLWRPEMYELIHFMGNTGAPFRVSPHDKNVLLTVGNQPVRLLKDVRKVFQELYQDSKWCDVTVGISSRTDAPHWARELLTKFTVSNPTKGEGDFVLSDVIQGPVEMTYESKVKHFQRMNRQTNIPFQDMIFFDNEYGNCQAVSALGVTVGYCPGGVCQRIWEKTLDAFSSSSSSSTMTTRRQGTIVEL